VGVAFIGDVLEVGGEFVLHRLVTLVAQAADSEEQGHPVAVDVDVG
jgi:hypothetical protein